MLSLLILVSLVQLPPDPAALPPPPARVVEIMPADQKPSSPVATYRLFLQVPEGERRGRFERLSSDSRSAIVRQHVQSIIDTQRLTSAELKALQAVRRTATPAAFSGDPVARHAFEDAEKQLPALLSGAVLAAYRSLLPAPKKGQDKALVPQH